MKLLGSSLALLIAVVEALSVRRILLSLNRLSALLTAFLIASLAFLPAAFTPTFARWRSVLDAILGVALLCLRFAGWWCIPLLTFVSWPFPTLGLA